MSVSVSGPVYSAIAALKSEAEGAVQLLQNQVATAQRTVDEYASILGELVNADSAPVVEPAPVPVIDPASPGLG